MSYWNYRIIRRHQHETDTYTFQIHEKFSLHPLSIAEIHHAFVDNTTGSDHKINNLSNTVRATTPIFVTCKSFWDC